MRRRRKPRAVSPHSVPRFSILKAKCSDPRMHVALDMLETCELTHELGAAELSVPLNLSASRVRHLFKQQLGFSPAQVLKMRRMHEARELLLSTFLRIKEVRMKVGMQDASHFTRDFRHIFGHSPSEARRQNIGKPRRPRARGAGAA